MKKFMLLFYVFFVFGIRAAFVPASLNSLVTQLKNGRNIIVTSVVAKRILDHALEPVFKSVLFKWKPVAYGRAMCLNLLKNIYGFGPEMEAVKDGIVDLYRERKFKKALKLLSRKYRDKLRVMSEKQKIYEQHLSSSEYESMKDELRKAEDLSGYGSKWERIKGTYLWGANETLSEDEDQSFKMENDTFSFVAGAGLLGTALYFGNHHGAKKQKKLNEAEEQVAMKRMAHEYALKRKFEEQMKKASEPCAFSEELSPEDLSVAEEVVSEAEEVVSEAEEVVLAQK